MNQLIDRFGRKHTYLRISVTDRCNLRCAYCMPADGLKWKEKEEILTYEEITRLAGIFANLGVTKIRLTGGEPLVRRDLHLLIERLSHLKGIETIAMTTNAVLLSGQSRLLKNAGLQAINISLDTLRADRFSEITRRDDFHNVMNGIEDALQTGFDSIKLNVVVIKGFNDDELLDIVNWAKDKLINIRFIEYMPFKDNQWQPGGVLSYADMKSAIESQFNLIPLVSEPSAVAKDFAIAGHLGRVSFITSMTDSFCSSCNRLRLGSDGSVKSCLFYLPDIQLRDIMRAGITDRELSKLIEQAVYLKPEAHPPMEELATLSNNPMIEIGG